MGRRLDAVIVGARCAGSAVALLLARAGARVLVVDKGRPGTDTLSTHALMRGGVLQLHRWGVLPAIVAAGTPRVETTAFHYPDEEVTVAIEPRFGVDALYAPRRTLLDRTLVDAAAAHGAEFFFGARVEDVTRDARGRVTGICAATDGAMHHIEADLVIGADGRRSTIAARTGAASIATAEQATGVLYSYWEGLPAKGYHWHYGPGVSIGVIPTNGGATCVFVAVPSSRFRAEVRGDAAGAYDRLVRRLSVRLSDDLRGARRVEPIRGFAGEASFIKRGSGPGWALVGDAGYFKDPLTAHGITDALRDAELLARAVLAGTDAALAEYEATRDDLSRGLFDVTDRIASFAWTDAELKVLHRALSREMSREVRALADLEPLTVGVPAS